MHNGHTICTCFCMELGRNAYWQLKIRTTTMGWRQGYTRTERAFPTTIDHLRSSKILWHFYKITVKKMQYCYLDVSQGLNVMTSKYFRVKRYSTIIAVVLSIILQRVMSGCHDITSSLVHTGGHSSHSLLWGDR